MKFFYAALFDQFATKVVMSAPADHKQDENQSRHEIEDFFLKLNSKWTGLDGDRDLNKWAWRVKIIYSVHSVLNIIIQ